MTITLLGIVLLSGLGLWAGQRRLIYFPDRGAPVASGWEDVSYRTSDGLSLDAWYRAPGPGSPVVIVFNGNAGNRGGRLPLGEALAAGGLGVLLTDYRGYGGNPGHPTESGLALDATAAAAYVGDRAPEHPVVYFGESLGAAVAVELADRVPPAGLVLRSPFTSLTDVGRAHYPWLPVRWFLQDRYPSEERIGSLPVPLLVVAGDADRIVPVGQSRAVHAAAAGPKELVVIAGADHNDPALTHGSELVGAVRRFVAGLDPGAP